jgi:hypothetical protein
MHCVFSVVRNEFLNGKCEGKLQLQRNIRVIPGKNTATVSYTEPAQSVCISNIFLSNIFIFITYSPILISQSFTGVPNFLHPYLLQSEIISICPSICLTTYELFVMTDAQPSFRDNKQSFTVSLRDQETAQNTEARGNRHAWQQLHSVLQYFFQQRPSSEEYPIWKFPVNQFCGFWWKFNDMRQGSTSPSLNHNSDTKISGSSCIGTKTL